MTITQKLDLRQGQQLVMTPQLQQAIKLLQLTNLELAEFVESQLEENPFLERDESGNQPERGASERTEDRADADQVADPQNLDTDLSNLDTDAGPGDQPAADAGAGDWSNVQQRSHQGGDEFDAGEFLDASIVVPLLRNLLLD